MKIKNKKLTALITATIMLLSTSFVFAEETDTTSGDDTANNSGNEGIVTDTSKGSNNNLMIGTQILSSLAMGNNVSGSVAFDKPEAISMSACLSNNKKPEIGDTIMVTCFVVPEKGWKTKQPFTVMTMTKEESGIATVSSPVPIILQKEDEEANAKLPEGEPKKYIKATGYATANAHFYDGTSTLSEDAGYVSGTDFSKIVNNNTGDDDCTMYGASCATGLTDSNTSNNNTSCELLGTCDDSGGSSSSGPSTGWLNNDTDLDDLLDNGLSSGGNDWASSMDNEDLDDYFNGLSGDDIPGGLTEDLLGVDDNLYNDDLGNYGNYEDNEGTEYVGDSLNDTDETTNNYTYGDEDGDGSVGWADMAAMYQNGLNGLSPSNNSGMDANGGGLLGAITGNDGNQSLTDKIRQLLTGDGNEGSDINANNQDLYNEAKKFLLKNGFNIDDIKSGKNYDNNSAYTEPKLAWDMNRITTLLKAKKIKLNSEPVKEENKNKINK